MAAARLRRLSLLTASAVISSCVVIVGVTGDAWAAPPAATDVHVHGSGTTPLTVDMSWAAPSDPSYAGARVVVTAGTVATEDPADPAAVSRTDVPAPATVTTVGPLSSGVTYTATVFAADATNSYAPGASVTWTEPGALSDVRVQGADTGFGGTITATYTRIPTADHVFLCAVAAAPPPMTPSPGCAQAESVPGVTPRITLQVSAGKSYGVSLFPYQRWLVPQQVPLEAFGAAVPIGTVVVPDNPPAAPIDVYGSSTTAHTVLLSWYYNPPGEVYGYPTDLKDMLVFRASGTTAPSGTAKPIAVVPVGTNPMYGSYRATGLVTNQPYTFSVRARDLGGHLSKPTTRTMAAHVAGSFITDNNTPTRAWRMQRVTGLEKMAVAKDGSVHTLYVDGSSVYYRWRSSSGRWSTPARLGSGGHLFGDTFITVSARGRVAAAWQSPRGAAYRVRWLGHAWSATRYLPVPRDATLVAFVQDLKQRVHALLPYGTASRSQAGYLYLTDATGKWTTSRVTSLSDRSVLMTAHLAADPVTGSIVIVTSEWIAPRGASTGDVWAIRIGRTARTSTAFGRLTTLLTPARKDGPWPSAVLSVGGRIVIAARVIGANSVPATNGLYLLVGTRPSAMGAWRHIAGSTLFDANLVIGMPMQTVIDLAWTRFSPSWVRSSQGVFMSSFRYSASTHRWVFTTPQQRTNCNYDDRTIAIARDVNGHAFIGFIRH